MPDHSLPRSLTRRLLVRTLPLLLAGAAVLAPVRPALSATRQINDAAVHLLTANLSRKKITLPQATCPEIVESTHLSVKQRPELALPIVQTAIVYKLTSRGSGPFERAGDDLSCECITRIVRAAIQASPKQARVIIEYVLGEDPRCLDSLNGLLRDLAAGRIKGDGSGSNGEGEGSSDGMNAPAGTQARNGGDAGINPGADGLGMIGLDGSGFGTSGSSFPGSPGFSGSAPGGGFTLPPITVANTTNVTGL